MQSLLILLSLSCIFGFALSCDCQCGLLFWVPLYVCEDPSYGGPTFNPSCTLPKLFNSTKQCAGKTAELLFLNTDVSIGLCKLDLVKVLPNLPGVVLSATANMTAPPDCKCLEAKYTGSAVKYVAEDHSCVLALQNVTQTMKIYKKIKGSPEYLSMLGN